MKMNGFLLAALACCVRAFAEPPPAPPSWLLPYPEAREEARVQSEARTETTYAVLGKPEDVLAHYRKLFSDQKLPFIPNFDGLATTIRGARDGSLLITIRENGDQTRIRVLCVAKRTSFEEPPAPVISSGAKSTSRRQDEVTRQVLAQEEDAHRKRIESMSKFDDPVKVRSRKNEPAASGTRKN